MTLSKPTLPIGWNYALLRTPKGAYVYMVSFFLLNLNAYMRVLCAKTFPANHIMNWTTPDFICDGIYLGKSNSAIHLPTLHSLNITHILMVGLDLVAHHSNTITYKHILIDDKATEMETMLKSFKDACDYIDTAIANGGNVLVHCHAGVSRSPSVVCAWLMRTYNMTYIDAITYVQQWRPVVKPNKGFVNALLSWQHTL